MDDTSGSESQDTIERTSESEETMEDSSEEEISSEMIRRKLRQSGVIERVLDDFMPCMRLHVIYADTIILLGDRLWLSQVQTGPQLVAYCDDSLPESVHNGVYIIVMTDADDLGGEYLQALCIGNDIRHEHAGIDAPSPSLVDHEPPRTAGRTIVFTLFTASSTQNIHVPITRENFSTRDFAARNAFGPPLTAAFFYIKHENENNDDNGCTESLRSDLKESPPHSKIDYALPAKPKDAPKIYFNLLKPKEFRPTPVPSSTKKKTEDGVEDDSVAGSSGITYYRREDNDSSTCNTEEISCKHEHDDPPGKQSDDESATP